jgi:hypothetical protein
MHLVYLIALGGHPQVAEAVRAVQARIQQPYLDLVPTSRLHVSVQGMDVPRQVWHERAAELRTASRQALDRVAPFDLRVGSANSFDVATILEIHDGGKIHALRSALRATLPAWTGVGQDPYVRDGEDDWIPHLSIAYYNAPRDAHDLVETLSDLRALEPVPVTVDTIQLVSVPTLRGPDRWLWPLEATFPL